MARRTDIDACLDQLPVKPTKTSNILPGPIVLHIAEAHGFDVHVLVDTSVHHAPYLRVSIPPFLHSDGEAQKVVDFTKFSETWQKLKARDDLWSCHDDGGGWTRQLLPCSAESSRVPCLVDVANALVSSVCIIDPVPTLVYLAYRKLAKDDNAIDMLLARLTGNPRFTLDVLQANADHDALRRAQRCGQVSKLLPEGILGWSDQVCDFSEDMLQKYPRMQRDDPIDTRPAFTVPYKMVWGEAPLPPGN